MTENKAINEIIKEVCSGCYGSDEEPHRCSTCGFKMAKDALSEIQQYRAIGTVKGYELAINESIDKHNLMIVYKDRLKEYESIGTIDEFKDLKEKNEPKELAEHNFQDEVHHYLCPSCRSIVSCNQNYCDECGQKLDWSE